MARHPFAIGSAAALALLAFLLFSPTQATPAADLTVKSNPPHPVAPKAPAVNAPNWQVPRFIEQGAYSPEQIDAAGSHVLLAAHLWGADVPKPRFLLYYSPDHGETWSKLLDNDANILGVCVDEKGQSAWLSSPPADRYFQAVEWNTRLFTASTRNEKIWTFEMDQFGTYAHVLRADGGHWVFTEQARMKRLKGINGPDADAPVRSTILVAFGKDFSCPKQVSSLASPDEIGMAAWAYSDNVAGVITTANQWQALVQHTTEDGGKTFTQRKIPFSYAPDSSSVIEQFVPLLVKRDGQKLALVVEAQFLTKKGATNPKDTFYQHFVLTSKDLGKSWSQPLPVTRTQPEYAEISVTGLHLSGDSIYVCTTEQNKEMDTMAVKNGKVEMGKIAKPKVSGDNPFANGAFTSELGGGATATVDGTETHAFSSWTSYTTKLLVSHNKGSSWSNHHALDALGQKSSGALMAGSGADIHVSLFNEPNPIDVKMEDEKKGNFRHEAEQYLVVRSLVESAWAASQTPPPPSFKEAKPPVPTPEEF